jgi:ABC-type uncharacterized transport system permease subunit
VNDGTVATDAPDAHRPVTPAPALLRPSRPRLPDATWSVIGVVCSLGFLAPLLAVAGADIGHGYDALFTASFGSTFGFSYLLLASTPLVLVGIGVALPFRAGMFNLGGEGQLLVGALAAVEVALAVSGTASPVSFLLPLAVGAGAGAVPGAIAGLLKAWRGVSEIVTTIMLGFIIILVNQYLVSGPLQGKDAVYATSGTVPSGFRLGSLGPDALIPVGFVVAIAAAIAVWLLAEFTRRGWRQRLIGLNPRVAVRQAIRIRTEWVIALTLGGALAGLGGAAEVLGNQLRVGLVFSPGWGWDAIAIALLARGNALAVVPFALYFGFLRNGALVLQQDLQVSPDLVLAMGGAPVILVAAIIGYRAYRRFVTEPAPD